MPFAKASPPFGGTLADEGYMASVQPMSLAIAEATHPVYEPRHFGDEANHMGTVGYSRTEFANNDPSLVANPYPRPESRLGHHTPVKRFSTIRRRRARPVPKRYLELWKRDDRGRTFCEYKTIPEYLREMGRRGLLLRRFRLLNSIDRRSFLGADEGHRIPGLGWKRPANSALRKEYIPQDTDVNEDSDNDDIETSYSYDAEHSFYSDAFDDDLLDFSSEFDGPAGVGEKSFIFNDKPFSHDLSAPTPDVPSPTFDDAPVFRESHIPYYDSYIEDVLRELEESVIQPLFGTPEEFAD